MDSEPEEFTQPTQKALDPRRVGKQHSGFSDEDISDIICLLLPYSEKARRELLRVSQENPQFTIGRDDAEKVDPDYDLEDDAGQFYPYGAGEHAIILRLSSQVKDPNLGFTFGRNRNRCDVCLFNDMRRRLSNLHFRIYLNEYGVLMLEDKSTNGTIVDEKLLKAKSNHVRRTLNSGSRIKVLLAQDSDDLIYMVRIPRRDGEYEKAYQRNLVHYMDRQRMLGNDSDATIVPGLEGPIDLFPTDFRDQQGHRAAYRDDRRREGEVAQRPIEAFSKAWNGSDVYYRVGEIGKGAFATVYKVTRRFDGHPFAAKELDKRKFMKNGVLDQKVDNEMRIMQRVQHPNIVRYMEHLDWDDRLLIIIMEYVGGGDLGKLILDNGPLSEDATKIMARQLLQALGYLHEKNITHRDVKPDNILVSSQQPFVVKLTDFGLSKMVDNEQTFLRTFCGTLLYCAPEVYSEYTEYDEYGRRHPRNRQRHQSSGQRYDHAVDIWSLGGVLFYALTGKPPYPAQSGISYSELLHQIMTRPLDDLPLRHASISGEGIDFLSRMLVRRPESRATVEELLQHQWLGGPGFHRGPGASQSYDEISDDELQQSASQLKLEDKENQDDLESDDEIADDEDIGDENLPTIDESEKENYTFESGNQAVRLFGEVNVSAVGSSGAVPSDLLNLPLSYDSLGTKTGAPGGSVKSEVGDSFDSEESGTPKQKSQHSVPHSGGWLQIPSMSAELSGESVEALNNKTFDVASQSLGGASSILGNLNMKSLAGQYLRSYGSDLTSSKRKPSHDTSDEFENALAPRERPVAKRIRSEVLESPIDSANFSEDDSEYELYAHIPSIIRPQSGRQIDNPVHKAAYWSADDRKSWHLRYPEMTQLQLDAFKAAADVRGEKFGPRSSLWGLAVKYFPASHYEEAVSQQQSWATAESRSQGKRELSAETSPGLDVPPTAPFAEDPPDSLPDTLPPEPQIIVPVAPADPSKKRVVATFESTAGSVVPNISVSITESMVSWGRAPENTRPYRPKAEAKVPKHGFKVLLWKDHYDPAKDFRPWAHGWTVDEDLFYFYISTKATQGIFINGVHLPSHDCKNPLTPAKHWMRLHDGDQVDVWVMQPGNSHKTSLTFRCFWGGSAESRPSQDSAAGVAGPSPVARVPESLAKRLDEACARAERKMPDLCEHDRRMEEATLDANQRKLTVERERERSRVFETRRVEACRVLAARGSRRTSPALTVAGSEPVGRASLAPVTAARGAGHLSAMPRSVSP